MQAMFTSLLVVIWLDGRDASCKRELFGGLLEQTGCKILLIKKPPVISKLRARIREVKHMKGGDLEKCSSFGSSE